MVVTYQQLLDHIHKYSPTSLDGMINALGVDPPRRGTLMAVLRTLAAHGVIIVTTNDAGTTCFRISADPAKVHEYADRAGVNRSAPLPL